MKPRLSNMKHEMNIIWLSIHLQTTLFAFKNQCENTTGGNSINAEGIDWVCQLSNSCCSLIFKPSWDIYIHIMALVKSHHCQTYATKYSFNVDNLNLTWIQFWILFKVLLLQTIGKDWKFLINKWSSSNFFILGWITLSTGNCSKSEDNFFHASSMIQQTHHCYQLIIK